MSTTVKVQIQQRIDTASNWTTANPTLLSGEVGWESDTKKYKIGDGSTAWASLAYAPGSGGYTAGTGVSISASNVITASAVALSQVFTAANQTAHLALTTQEGDIVVRSDENKSYVRNSGSASDMTDYTLLATPTDAVLSVNGNTGAITAAQLAAAIESATDSNTFTDADHTKLNSLSTTPEGTAITSTGESGGTKFLREDGDGTCSWQSATVDVSGKANLSGATFTGDVVFTGDAANVTWDKSTDDLIFNDNAKAIFGTSSDGLEIFHNGNHSYIDHTGTGDLWIRNTQTNGDIYIVPKDSGAFVVQNTANEVMIEGSSNGAVKLFYDNVKTFETHSNGVIIRGPENGSADLYMWSDEGDDDADKWRLQAENGSSGFTLKNSASGSLETNIKAVGNGAVELYWDNSKKLATESAGVAIWNGNIRIPNDTYKMTFGASALGDLQIYFDGSNSYIKEPNSVPGQLVIDGYNGTDIRQGSTGDHMIRAIGGGAVKLYWDGSLKLETESDGVKITGNLTVDTNTLHVDATNNRVGIGLTTPTTTLEVSAGTNKNFNVWSSGAYTTGITIGSVNDAFSAYTPVEVRASEWYFHNGTTERMRIDSSGRLLLGTTTEGHASGDDLTIATTGNTGITIRTGSSNEGNIFFSDGTSGDDEYRGMVKYEHANNALKLYTNAATALTIDSSQNATFAGTVSDSKGDLRSIPQNTQGSAYELLAADAGKHILASGNITWVDSRHAAGDAITIVNNTAGDITITKGTTMYNTADGNNANRTLATRGMATILWASGTVAYISGAGLS